MASPEALRIIRRRPPDRTLDWVAASVGPGSRVGAVRPMRGATARGVHAVDVVDREGRVHRLVLRRWVENGWEVLDPDMTAGRELTVLRLLERSNVEAPRVVAADPDAEAADVPAILMTRLPGHPPVTVRDVEGFLSQLAKTAVAIHAVQGAVASGVAPYRQWNDFARVTAPPWARRPAVWQRAIQIARRPRPAVTDLVFIHRDYHPGNTLWSRGRLTGVVDWTAASVGSRSVDVAHMRWNLAVEYGVETADRFLALYRPDGFRHDPYWDAVTVVDLLSDVEPRRSPPDPALSRLEDYLVSVAARTG